MTENPGGGSRIPLAELKPRMQLTGKVTRLELSGAVLDVGADREGWLHISAMGKENVNRVQDILEIGQEVTVWVRKTNPEKGELQLTMVQPVAHEWADLRPGTTIHGKVSRVEKFGVFVEFGAERPGLIHISELSNEYVKETSDIAKVGDSIDAVVLEVDRKKRQVHLSRKALLGKVEKANEVKEEDESEEEIKTITAMEAAFQKAQSGAQDSPATKSARLKATTEERRRQQEELLSRTLQTAPRK